MTANWIDQIIKAAFADEGADSVYGNGLCRPFALGLDRFLRAAQPDLQSRLLIGHHDGAFDHAAIYLPNCDASFDWQGAGAQERWTAHRGGEVEWSYDLNLLCYIHGGRLGDWQKIAATVAARLVAAASQPVGP